jgi:hypothetical protein
MGTCPQNRVFQKGSENRPANLHKTNGRIPPIRLFHKVCLPKHTRPSQVLAFTRDISPEHWPTCEE